MYHQPISNALHDNGFSKNIDLLHLADMLMIDDLKKETIGELGRILSKANYVEISQAAEVYHAESLISECAHFVLEKVTKGNVNWEEMGKLPKVMAAFGKKVQEEMGIMKETMTAKDIQISAMVIQIRARDVQIRAKDIQIVNAESVAANAILQREEALRELNSVKEEKKENFKTLFRKFSEGVSVRLCANIPRHGLLKGDTGVVHKILRTAALEGNPGKDLVTVAVA